MGYLDGAEDYWLHGSTKALDYFSGEEPLFNYTCWEGNLCPVEKYSANILTEHAIQVINEVGRPVPPGAPCCCVCSAWLPGDSALPPPLLGGRG